MSSDYQLEDTLHLPFTTRAFATGLPTTLAGTPAIDIYEDDTATPIITGESLSVDHNSLAGLNVITITATAATGFESGKSYFAAIQAGTVDDVSVVGEVVAHFTLDKSSATKNIDSRGTATGAALNYEASADNTAGAIIDAVTIVGSITANLFSDTDAENGTRHQLTHAGNAFDFVYRLPVGGGRTGVTVEWKGYLTSANDVCSIQAYDHVGVGWDTIATISGQGGTTNSVVIAALLSKHTGTGGELGNVYIRFVTTGQTSPVLNTDLLLVQAVNIGQSVGYGSAFIHYDSVNGVAGTEPYINGAGDNPVKDEADAVTLAAAVNLKDFHIINGSTWTAAASLANTSFFGDHWTMALGGQAAQGLYCEGATVSGVGTSTGEEMHFEGCDIGTASVQHAHFDKCGFEGTVTQTLAGDYQYHNCYEKGATAPVFTKTAGQAITMEFVNWSGDLTISGLQAGDTVIIGGTELGDVILNGAEATVDIRGIYKDITDNRTGSPTLTVTGAQTGGKIRSIGLEKNKLTPDYQFYMELTAGGPALGKTVAVAVNIDDAGYVAADNTPATEIAFGKYRVDLSAADKNGDLISFRFSEADCVDTFFDFKTTQ